MMTKRATWHNYVGTTEIIKDYEKQNAKETNILYFTYIEGILFENNYKVCISLVKKNMYMTKRDFKHSRNYLWSFEKAQSL